MLRARKSECSGNDPPKSIVRSARRAIVLEGNVLPGHALDQSAFHGWPIYPEWYTRIAPQAIGTVFLPLAVHPTRCCGLPAPRRPKRILPPDLSVRIVDLSSNW